MIASFTLLPILSAQFGGSDSMAGIPNTLIMVGRALIAYPIGWLMDRHGRRLGLTIGYALAAMGGLVSAYSIGLSSFMILCAGSMLAGMGRGVTEQARFVAGDARVAAERASAIGLIVLAGTVGAVGGPLMVEPTRAFMKYFGYTADSGPFVAMLLLNALAMLMVFALLRPDPLAITRVLEQKANGNDKKAVPPARPISQIFAGSLVRLAIAAMVIGQLVMTLIMVITPLYMHHHNHGAGPISGVIMAHTLGMFGLSTVTGKLIGRFGRITMINMGAAILALSAILTPISVNVWTLGLALFLLGSGWNFCFIAGSSLLSDALAANERGRAQGANRDDGSAGLRRWQRGYRRGFCSGRHDCREWPGAGFFAAADCGNGLGNQRRTTGVAVAPADRGFVDWVIRRLRGTESPIAPARLLRQIGALAAAFGVFLHECLNFGDRIVSHGFDFLLHLLQIGEVGQNRLQ